MVRLMTIHDVPFYNCVRNECCEYLHDPTTYTLPQAYEWFSKNLNPFFMYELNNETIGYFRTSDWTKDSCYIGMDIHKDYRGRKLAVSAYTEMIEHIKTNYTDIQTLNLEVLSHNTRAYNLYKKLGFKEISRYIHHSCNDMSIIMEKQIKDQ